MKKYIILLSFFISVFMFGINVNAAGDKSEGKAKPFIVVVGDSRTCGYSNSLNWCGKYKLLDSKMDLNKSEVEFPHGRFFENESSYVLVFGYGGGSCLGGEMDFSWNQVFDYLETVQAENISKYIFYNCYGINDMYSQHSLQDKKQVSMWYMDFDKEIIKKLPQNSLFYQCTIPDMNTTGTIFSEGHFENTDIDTYNELIRNNNYGISIYDLAGVASENNIVCRVTEENPCGLHYELDTGLVLVNKIIDYSFTKASYE